MTLRRLHRMNAAALGLFLVAHLVNHLTVLAGLETHLAVMEALRSLYRLPPVEVALLGLFAAQVLLGLALSWRRGWPSGNWARAQILSGLYLAFFLTQHLIAVVATRSFYPGIQTTSYWAASVVSRAPFVWYFAPYYALAIFALFTHIAAALRFRRWKEPSTPLVRALPVAGAVLAVAIVASLIARAHGGLPPEYDAYLDSYWGS